ncbi:MAG: 2-amino-4-hydroxy-6-hydroxymethyldihydropteridine diphosphokinase [Chloroflexota bacterium]
MTSDEVTIYLGLGSNMDNRKENLARALELLAQRVSIVLSSSIYDTAPVGNADQPRFLNMVCQGTTRLAPMGLLMIAKAIESKMGRVAKVPNAPRPIDIDILFYGNQKVNSPDLVIPHPRIAERAFVLVPLAEIAPELVHPALGKKIKELRKKVEGQDVLPYTGE